MGATLRRRPCATPTTRALNQYTRKENNSVRVTGTTASNANVAFLGTMSTTRVGRTWANSIDPANISGPAVGLATAFATVPGGPPIRIANSLWLSPKRQQVFTYDANGNLDFGGGRTVTWTSFNQLLRADMAGGKFSEFAFGAGRERVKQTSQLGTTTYVGALFERFTPAGAGAVTENKHYIFTPAGRVAVYTERSDLTRDTRWFHTDGLGSITAVTNEAGAIVKRFAFDAWGKRLTPSTNGVITTNAATGSTASGGYTRGYTDHEQLDDLGLIHMNGRVYDPVLGRFLSADPFVDDSGDSQAFNRYSYVSNNPMAFSDPSGYFKFWKDFLGPIVQVVATVYFGPLGGAAVGATINGWKGAVQGFVAGIGGGLGYGIGGTVGFFAGYGAASGFSGSLLNGGSIGDAFKAGVVGGVIGGVSAYIGAKFNVGGIPSGAKEYYTQLAMMTVTGGTAGGIYAAANGQEFWDGFRRAAKFSAAAYIFMTGLNTYLNEEGNRLTPAGGSENYADYDRVDTDGILGKQSDMQARIDAATAKGNPTLGYQNPSQGIINDVMQSFWQKMLFGYGDSLAAGFNRLTAQMAPGPLTITAHSQGTLTVTNAILQGGVPRGSTLNLLSPAISRPRAWLANAINGGTLNYNQPWFDGANLWGFTLNPVKYASGVVDLFRGFKTHTSQF